MKLIFISIFFLFLKDDFLEKITNDFNKNSLFLPVTIQTENGQNKYIIENLDLFFYYQKKNNYNEKDYKNFIKKNIEKIVLKIHKKDIPNYFIPILEDKIVLNDFLNGREYFLNKYFSKKNALVYKVEKKTESLLIYLLFKIQIGCKYDSETGFLIIEK